MLNRAAPPRQQRAAVLATVFALHAGLIALFLQQSVKSAPAVKPTSMAMIAFNAVHPAAAKPPPPSLPTKLADTFKPVIEFSMPADTESESPAGASEVCPTLSVVLDALLLDTAAIAAIRSAPPETRSIAGAVMMWNEGWIPAALTEDAPLWALRVNVEATLAQVPDACLDEEIVGPRLLPIPEANGTRTLFVVVGSGRWMWRQMLSPPSILMPIVPLDQNSGEQP